MCEGTAKAKALYQKKMEGGGGGRHAKGVVRFIFPS